MTKKSKYFSGVIAVIIAAIMWGIDGVILTPNLLGNNGLPLDLTIVVFILHAIPFIIMNIIWSKSYKSLKKFSKSDFIIMSIIAITGGAFGTICIVKALFLVNFHNLTIVALLQKMQPIFAILLSVFILKERLSRRYFLWATITIIAGYIMTFGFNLPSRASGDNILEAALLALLAALFFGTSTVLSKKMLMKYNPSETTFFRYGFTSILMLAIVLSTNKINLITSIPQQTWIIFLIIAFTTGSGAILLYYHGLRHIDASISTICELFFPITAALLDYFINNNTMTILQWIAAVIMIFAIIKLTQTGQKPKTKLQKSFSS